MNPLRSRISSILPTLVRCYCSEAPKKPKGVYINRVQLLGRLGRDPEIRGADATRRVVTFPMATNEFYTDAEGHRQQGDAEWHRIVITMPNLQEIAMKHLRKSARVLVNGRLKYTMVEVPGSMERRSVAGIRADEIIFLDLGSRESAASRFNYERKYNEAEAEEKEEVEVNFDGEEKKEAQSPKV